ncbi:hypothetical protein LJR245_007503 [Rhizobium leguminosarum]|uniref:hypothetical protein n=1 Tax=Rhizobium leguminosarum TaxID=384 RepID=UPI003ECE30DF
MSRANGLPSSAACVFSRRLMAAEPDGNAILFLQNWTIRASTSERAILEALASCMQQSIASIREIFSTSSCSMNTRD